MRVGKKESMYQLPLLLFLFLLLLCYVRKTKKKIFEILLIKCLSLSYIQHIVEEGRALHKEITFPCWTDNIFIWGSFVNFMLRSLLLFTHRECALESQIEVFFSSTGGVTSILVPRIWLSCFTFVSMNCMEWL